MRYDDIIKHFGGVTQAAKALGMTRQAVYNWRTQPIPYPRQLLIQQVSRGRLKATNGATDAVR